MLVKENKTKMYWAWSLEAGLFLAFMMKLLIPLLDINDSGREDNILKHKTKVEVVCVGNI